MKVTTTTSSIFTVLTVFAAAVVHAKSIPTENVTYSNIYDNGAQSLSSLACAQWAKEKHYKTLSDVPGFPYVAGAPAVAYGHTKGCGEYYSIKNQHTHKIIRVTVVDASGSDFVLSSAAFNNVTDGKGSDVGSFKGIVNSEKKLHA